MDDVIIDGYTMTGDFDTDLAMVMALITHYKEISVEDLPDILLTLDPSIEDRMALFIDE